MKSALTWIFVALLTLPLTLATVSAAPSESDDALQNLARERFKVALDKAHEFVFSCRANPSECGLTRTEETLLHHIYNELIFGSPRAAIAFISETEQPGTFQIDGALRIAKTGNQQGDTIFVNTDLIVTTGEDGRREALSFDAITALLVHELGHHAEGRIREVIPHQQLDVLGNKVRQQMLRYAQIDEVTRSNWQALQGDETIRVEHFASVGNRGQDQERSSLYLTGPFGLINLSGVAKDRVTCPRAYYRDELDFEGKAFAMYLKRYTFDAAAADASALTITLSISDASMLCINELEGHDREFMPFPRYRNGRLTLRLTHGEDGKIVFDIDATRFQITTPPDTHWH